MEHSTCGHLTDHMPHHPAPLQPAWNLRTNPKAMGIANPIRELIEKMGAPNPDKPVIALSQGAPCHLHPTVSYVKAHLNH